MKFILSGVIVCLATIFLTFGYIAEQYTIHRENDMNVKVNFIVIETKRQDQKEIARFSTYEEAEAKILDIIKSTDPFCESGESYHIRKSYSCTSK